VGYCLSKLSPCTLPGKVEPSIIKTHTYRQTFSNIFYSFLNQIEWFLCHWMRKLKGYKCSLSVRSKGVIERTQEDKWVIVCFQNFEQLALDPSLVPTSYLPHF
jgi:hypothetical protein